MATRHERERTERYRATGERAAATELELPLEGFRRPATRAERMAIERDPELVEPAARRSASRPRRPPAESRRPPAEPRRPPADLVRPPAELRRPPAEPLRSPSEPRRPPAESRRPPAEPRRPPADPGRRPADPGRRPRPVNGSKPARAPVRPKSERAGRGGLPRRQQILLPFVALIAMAAGGVGVVALTNEPRTTSLQSEVSSLQSELAGARAQLTALQHSTASNAQVKHLSASVAGMRRTVAALQGSSAPLAAKVNALLTCLPQLQSELNSASVRGHGKPASVLSSLQLSPGCAALLGSG